MNDAASIATRRAYPRMDVRIPVRIQQCGNEAPISGVTLNLLRSGTLVRTESPVVSGARYFIQFLRAESFDLLGGTVCARCGAVPTP